MIRKNAAVFLVSAALFIAAPAWGWGLTIEDLMEREGISRTDRIDDLRKLILDAYNLEKVLPWENFAPDLEGLIGTEAVSAIKSAYEEFSSAYDAIEEIYGTGEKLTDAAGGLPEGLTADVAKQWGRLTELTDAAGEAVSDALALDWKKYKKDDASTGVGTIDVFEAVKESAEKKWEGGKSRILETGTAQTPGAAAAAALGSARTEGAHEIYQRKAVSDFAVKAGQEQAELIIKDIAAAQAAAAAIKKKGRGAGDAYMGTLAGRQDSLASSGAAWRAASASYAALSKLRGVKDIMAAEILYMAKIKFRLRAREAVLGLSDYVNFCMKAMEIKSKQESAAMR